MYCGECKEECNIMEYDDSFNWHNGVYSHYHYGSDCCDANIFESVCSDCKGSGKIVLTFNPYNTNVFRDKFIEEIECENCHGVGLVDLIEM